MSHTSENTTSSDSENIDADFADCKEGPERKLPLKEGAMLLGAPGLVVAVFILEPESDLTVVDSG